MKSFFKFIGVVATIFATVFGALALFDKFLKKGYYICDQTDNDEKLGM